MKLLVSNSEKGYVLHQDESSGDLYLEVLVGGVGMCEVSHKLSSEEVERYNERGGQFLSELAFKIQKIS